MCGRYYYYYYYLYRIVMHTRKPSGLSHSSTRVVSAAFVSLSRPLFSVGPFPPPFSPPFPAAAAKDFPKSQTLCCAFQRPTYLGK